MTEEVARIITDDRLLSLFAEHGEKVSDYVDFSGQYYTYRHKGTRLTIDSSWSRLKEGIERVLSDYGNDASAILSAIYEVNYVHNMTYKNYYPVHTLAMNKGMKKNWQKVLSELRLLGIIDELKDMHIPEEQRPLIEEVLAL